MIRGQTCTDVGAPSCYTSGRRCPLSYFVSPSPSWWHHRTLLVCCFFFSCTSKLQFWWTISKDSSIIFLSCNSQFKFSLLCFRSHLPIQVTLFICTEWIDLLFFHFQHWERHIAKFQRAHQIPFQQSPAVMEHHLTFLSKAKTVQL